MKNTLLLIFFCFQCIFILKAQIVTDRPDQTEASSTIPNHALQVESGILTGYQDDVRQLVLPNTLLRYGLTDKVEFRFITQLEINNYNDTIMEGMSDLWVGTKIQLFKKPESNTEVAFLTHLSVPTGSKVITSGSYGIYSRLLLSHRINDFLNLGYNIGYDYTGIGLESQTANRGSFIYTASLGISINDSVGAYIESFGEFGNLERHMSSFDAGFIYQPSSHIQLDFSFGLGLNHDMNYTSIGCSWLFISNR